MTDLSVCTKVSPRFECNTLCYYAGDTFQLLLPIELIRDGVPVEIGPDDTVTVTIVNSMLGEVEVLEFTGIEDNTITIDWDLQRTAKYPPGAYSYRIRFNGEYVRTIAADCRILVQ